MTTASSTALIELIYVKDFEGKPEGMVLESNQNSCNLSNTLEPLSGFHPFRQGLFREH